MTEILRYSSAIAVVPVLDSAEEIGSSGCRVAEGTTRRRENEASTAHSAKGKIGDEFIFFFFRWLDREGRRMDLQRRTPYCVGSF